MGTVLALENAALRQQIGTYLRRKKRPQLPSTDRALWVVLRKIWPGWQDSLAFVKPLYEQLPQLDTG